LKSDMEDFQIAIKSSKTLSRMQGFASKDLGTEFTTGSQSTK
jgi:hypothetical protein